MPVVKLSTPTCSLCTSSNKFFHLVRAALFSPRQGGEGKARQELEMLKHISHIYKIIICQQPVWRIHSTLLIIWCIWGELSFTQRHKQPAFSISSLFVLSLPVPFMVSHLSSLWILNMQANMQSNIQNAVFVITCGAHFSKQYPRVWVSYTVYYQYPAKEACVCEIVFWGIEEEVSWVLHLCLLWDGAPPWLTISVSSNKFSFSRMWEAA